MRQIIVTMLITVLLSCNEGIENQTEPVLAEPPVSKAADTDINDSSFLRIKIANENYEISFFNKTFPAGNINALEAFLKKNKELINKDKVLVTGFVKNEHSESFVHLLSKYGITRFRVQ